MAGVWRRLKRNKLAMVSLGFLIFIVIVAILAPIISPYDYAAQNGAETLRSPNAQHWFGTDNFGRDIFSRILNGQNTH